MTPEPYEHGWTIGHRQPPLPHPQGEYRWVLCSRELIAQMMEGWSPTVELMVTKMDDTTLEFVARTHTCAQGVLAL